MLSPYSNTWLAFVFVKVIVFFHLQFCFTYVTCQCYKAVPQSAATIVILFRGIAVLPPTHRSCVHCFSAYKARVCWDFLFRFSPSLFSVSYFGSVEKLTSSLERGRTLVPRLIWNWWYLMSCRARGGGIVIATRCHSGCSRSSLM